MAGGEIELAKFLFLPQCNLVPVEIEQIQFDGEHFGGRVFFLHNFNAVLDEAHREGERCICVLVGRENQKMLIGNLIEVR